MYTEVPIFRHSFDFDNKIIEIESESLNSDELWQEYCQKNNIESKETPDSTIYTTEKTVVVKICLT